MVAALHEPVSYWCACVSDDSAQSATAIYYHSVGPFGPAPSVPIIGVKTTDQERPLIQLASASMHVESFDVSEHLWEIVPVVHPRSQDPPTSISEIIWSEDYNIVRRRTANSIGRVPESPFKQAVAFCVTLIVDRN